VRRERLAIVQYRLVLPHFFLTLTPMPRFQFSLWWLMVAITVLCVVLFLSVTIGDFLEVAIASVLWCVLPTPIVILAIYGRGDWQAFAIGALIPWVTLIAFRVPATLSFFVATLWLLPMCAVCGIVAGVTRRWIKANLGE
jgi:hypothetical protein